MPDKNDDVENHSDHFDDASGVSFRDYPSSALVVFAAVGSGLAWMLYKWLGRKKPAQDSASDDLTEGKNQPEGGASSSENKT